MEYPTDFTFNESFNREELLAEALEIIRYSDVTLSDKSSQVIDENKAQAIDLIDKLQNEQASFSPKLDVIPLTKEKFEQDNLKLVDDLEYRMKNNNFYLISIPITLFPKAGWAFTRLECHLEFCPEENDANQRPIIHDIFPDNVWQEILTFEDSLNLGLDENLAFRAEVEKLEGNWKKLSGEAQAKLSANLGGKANLVVGPFSYRIRRPEIYGTGKKDVKAFWRLDGTKYVQGEDVSLGVVLSVPKTRTLPVSASGVLRAYHDSQLLLSNIFKDWFPTFSSLLKSFFKKGSPVQSEQKWENLTMIN